MYAPPTTLLLALAWPPAYSALSFPCRGTTTVDGAGFGIDRPAELSKEDDEYEAFRKRMMLAYRFRPNPLVRVSPASHTASGWALQNLHRGVAVLITELPLLPQSS